MTHYLTNLPQKTVIVNIEPWQSRREPFLELCRELARQRDRYTGGNDRETDLSATARSVAAVTNFLIAAVPDAPELSEILHRLGISLMALDQGLTPPLLKPQPKPNGQRKPLEVEMLWAIAAAVVTLQIKEHRVSLHDATRKVEHEFELQTRPLPGHAANSAAHVSMPGNRLRYWRDRLLERRPDDPARAVYDSAIKDAETHQEDGIMAPPRWSVRRRYNG